MNTKMLDSTLLALKINIIALSSVIERIEKTKPEYLETVICGDFSEIETLSKRISELTIIGTGAVKIG